MSQRKEYKHVAKGIFYAELNEFLMRELAEEGYSGVSIRKTAGLTEIVIRAAHTQAVLGEHGRRVRELTSLIEKRFGFDSGSISVYAENVLHRGLSAVAQCESLRYKLFNGLAIRRAAYGIVRFVMESGAKGVEVVVSGKLRAARAKTMKFQDGFLIHSGQPVKDFVDVATRHVLLRQGVLGIKVTIMRDPATIKIDGVPATLPDQITIFPPKQEQTITEPHVILYDGAGNAIDTEALEREKQEQAQQQQQAQPVA